MHGLVSTRLCIFSKRYRTGFYIVDTAAGFIRNLYMKRYRKIGAAFMFFIKSLGDNSLRAESTLSKHSDSGVFATCLPFLNEQHSQNNEYIEMRKYATNMTR
jgi:hypothetical protein